MSRQPDPLDSYRTPLKYLAWVRNTNEKLILQQRIKSEYEAGRLAVMPQNANKRILDLGCGNGINSVFLAQLFANCQIDAIDRSPAQIEYASSRHTATNLHYYCSRLEDYCSAQGYDFILASHILQYIDSPFEVFAEKVLALIRPGGEAWIVQQTRKGMAEIIAHQQPFLISHRFRNWQTFEDYCDMMTDLVKSCTEFEMTTLHLDTSIAAINFANPNEDDKLRLEFIFCLDASYDAQSAEFKAHLATCALSSQGRIAHPNGIMRIARR